MFHDAKPIDDLSIDDAQASPGAPLSFWDNLRASFDYENLVESQYGAAHDLITQEQEMFQRIRRAGGTPPESAYLKGDVSGYYNLSRAEQVAAAVRDNDRRGYEDLVKTQDEELRVLKQRFPDIGIKTYGEMYGDMIARRKFLEGEQQRGGNPVAGFIGAMGAAFNPATNPLSVLTAPVGGFGKTAAGRIATESLAQGGVQFVEEVTGIRGNKRLLGLDPTWQDTAVNVGAAAAFGGVLQGTGEALRVGAKTIRGKWFRDVEGDRAPPPPQPEPPPAVPPAAETVPAPPPRAGAAAQGQAPVARAIPRTSEEAIMQAVRDVAGTSRNIRRGAMADYNHMVSQMDRFDVAIGDIAPPMHTRPFTPPEQIAAPRIETPAGETVDQIARRIDPETFRMYDKLAREIEQMRSNLQQAVHFKNVEDTAALRTFDDAIAVETRKLQNANPRKAKIYQERIRELTAQRASEEARLLALDDVSSANYRQSVMKIDEKMRDLAPAVSRAYARARGKWAAYDEQRAQIEDMMQQGSRTLPPDVPDADAKIIDRAEAEFNKPTVVDYAPELQGAAKNEGEDFIDVSKRVNESVDKMRDAELDAMEAAIPRLLKDETGEEVIEVEGVGTVPLSRELVVDVDGDGTARKMTVREYLKTVQESSDELAALMTCSVGTISATA